MTWLLLLPVALAAGMAALSFLVGTVILLRPLLLPVARCPR
jgi:hypothetical protein